jgi:hypothetical protein
MDPTLRVFTPSAKLSPNVGLPLAYGMEPCSVSPPANNVFDEYIDKLKNMV